MLFFAASHFVTWRSCESVLPRLGGIDRYTTWIFGRVHTFTFYYVKTSSIVKLTNKHPLWSSSNSLFVHVIRVMSSPHPTSLAIFSAFPYVQRVCLFLCDCDSLFIHIIILTDYNSLRLSIQCHCTGSR